jgi:Tol biopolymer transport system component
VAVVRPEPLYTRRMGSLRPAAGLAALALVLAAAGSTHAAPTATPKNGRIVFQRLDPKLGQTRLYTVDASGRDLRPLTTPSRADGGDSQADWSADGRKLVFRRFVDSGLAGERVDLYVVNADGTGLRNLTRVSCTGLCRTNEEPAWAPNGKRIAFVRTIGPLPANGGPPPIVGIFLMNADGTHVQQVSQRRPNSGTEDHAPAWSPDGRRIAFMRANNTAKPPGASVVYVMNADGTHAGVLRTMSHRWPGAGAPAWSPDGTRILYSTSCWFGDCGQPRTGAQLFTIRSDGSGFHQVTRLSGNVGPGRWSPDGKQIVFARNARVGPTGDVYTINANGTGLRRLTRVPDLDAGNPDWGRRN